MNLQIATSNLCESSKIAYATLCKVYVLLLRNAKASKKDNTHAGSLQSRLRKDQQRRKFLSVSHLTNHQNNNLPLIFRLLRLHPRQRVPQPPLGFHLSTLRSGQKQFAAGTHTGSAFAELLFPEWLPVHVCREEISQDR